MIVVVVVRTIGYLEDCTVVKQFFQTLYVYSTWISDFAKLSVHSCKRTDYAHLSQSRTVKPLVCRVAVYNFSIKHQRYSGIFQLHALPLFTALFTAPFTAPFTALFTAPFTAPFTSDGICDVQRRCALYLSHPTKRTSARPKCLKFVIALLAGIFVLWPATFPFCSVLHYYFPVTGSSFYWLVQLQVFVLGVFFLG